MFELSVEGTFSAAHQVRGYPGDCAGLHGHTYRVMVRVAVERLDELGMAVDFRALRKLLEETLEELDHRNLNELPFFAQHNATAEYVAKYCYDRMHDKDRRVAAVTVWEGPDCCVTYVPDET